MLGQPRARGTKPRSSGEIQPRSPADVGAGLILSSFPGSGALKGAGGLLIACLIHWCSESPLFSRESFFLLKMAFAGIKPHECACIVCLDSDPPPIQSGCACRSDTGLALAT